MLLFAFGATGAVQARIDTSGQPAPPELTVESKEAVLQLFQTAIRLAGKEDIKGALVLAQRAVAAKAFAELPPNLQMAGYGLLGAYAVEERENQTAYDAFVKATGFKDANGDVWNGRADAAFSVGASADGYRSLTTVLRRFPEKLKDINPDWIGYKAYSVNRPDVDRATQADFLGALFDADWKNDGVTPSGAWLIYSVILADAGNADRLRAVAARIDDARTLVVLHADRRFDAVVAADRDRFDVMKAVDREIAHARNEWARTPRKIEPLTRLMGALITARRYDDVLALTDAALAKATGPGGAKAFSDRDDQLPWLYDFRARALQGLDRWDEAARARVQGAALKEHGAENVSQAINLGDTYNAMGRNKDALAAVDAVKHVSDFGRMQMEGVRYEALLTLHDPRAEDSLQYIKAHAAESFDTYLESLVLKGDMDGAAAVLIEALNDPGRRDDTLLELQDFAEPKAPPPREHLHAAMKALAARPDVTAALAKVGRAEHYALAPMS